MRMKLGDLEMEATSVVSSSEQTPEHHSNLDPMARRARRAVAACGAVTAACTGLGVFASIFLGGEALLGPAVMAGLSSGGAFITYFLIGWDSNRRARSDESPASVVEIRKVRLLEALETSTTVDELLRQLVWDEAVLLVTLRALVDAGEVEEDLDVESGEWIYRRSAPLLLEHKPTLSLEDRIEALSDQPVAMEQR